VTAVVVGSGDWLASVVFLFGKLDAFMRGGLVFIRLMDFSVPLSFFQADGSDFLAG